MQTTQVNDSSTHRYAGFWIRVAAAVLDTIFIMLLTTPILYLIYGDAYLSRADITLSNADTTPLFHGAWDILFTYVVPAIVVTVFWIYRSATPGKMILGLKIIRENSLASEPGQLTVKQALIRYLGYYLSTIPLFVGLIWVAFDKRKQGWHDKLAGTLVVYQKQ